MEGEPAYLITASKIGSSMYHMVSLWMENESAGDVEPSWGTDMVNWMPQGCFLFWKRGESRKGEAEWPRECDCRDN
jgi:hypothetical protein